MKEIYFDYNATAPVRPEAQEAWQRLGVAWEAVAELPSEARTTQVPPELMGFRELTSASASIDTVRARSPDVRRSTRLQDISTTGVHSWGVRGTPGDDLRGDK